MVYNRQQAVAYAHQWAFKRNPRYLDFSEMGGDCTNFISQCLHAGGAKMNYQPIFGWYYIDAANRAPAWSGVQYLYNFLCENQGGGPFAQEIQLEKIQIADVVQLAFHENTFRHSLLAVETGHIPNLSNTLIATHSDDSDYRPLSSYHFSNIRCLKINAR